MPSWRATAAASLSFVTLASASLQAHIRQPASVSYQGRNDCPALCSASGSNPTNWTAYHNLDQLRFCTETVFYHVGLYDAVDDGSTPHRIYACTSLGMLSTPTPSSNQTVVQAVDNATFTLGRFDENAPQGVDLRLLSKQMRRFLDAGSLTVGSNVPLILFAQTVSSTAGLYVGKGVATQPTVSDALVAMESALYASNNTGGSLALQLCSQGYTSDHIVGFIATSNTSFTPVQQAMRSWANATCLSFNSTQNLNSTAAFTTPLILANSNATINATINGTSTFRRWQTARFTSSSRLSARGDCTTVQVVSGDSCSSLATKCGISPSDFTEYNPGSSFCADLVPGQHVCCSSGTLPDFAPQPNSDGTCYAHTIASGDTCSGLSAAYDLTNDKIEGFNKNTWGWSGCQLLFIGDVICLSTGNPPMPAALSNALCGPQKPNTPAQGHE
jgi:hypothetical protein